MNMSKQQNKKNKFIEFFLSIKDKKNYLLLFDLFLTPEEREDLERRFLIIQELIKGKKTQRQIAKDLNVSIAKITRGSNELKRINPNLLRFLKERFSE